MSGENNDEWQQENLSIVDCVVDVRPVRGAAKCMYQEKNTQRNGRKPFLVFFKNNLSPQSLSSSFTDPFTFVTFTLVDKLSQKLMVVH